MLSLDREDVSTNIAPTEAAYSAALVVGIMFLMVGSWARSCFVAAIMIAILLPVVVVHVCICVGDRDMLEE